MVLGLVLLLLTAKALLNPQTDLPAALSGFRLWLAQGFGVGRSPRAPGTFGSVVGVGWFALLASTGTQLGLTVGTLAGLALSVWLCGEAERTLRRRDPGSVVLDEISAMPICFFAWAAIVFRRTGSWPGTEYFLRHWPLVVAVFAAFRFFDIVKPWPVRQSQALPGGWGVTIDDVLAAVYVNLVVLLVQAGYTLLT